MCYNFSTLDCCQRQRDLHLIRKRKIHGNNFADVPEIFSFHNVYFLIATTVACGWRGGSREQGWKNKKRDLSSKKMRSNLL